MPWDNSKISVGMYWLVHNIDSALESALMALIKMASSKRDSWELLLRKQISAGFGRNWRVNGEQSGRTKLIYVFNEGRGERNPRTTSTLDIPWERQSIAKIIGAIEYIKPLVQDKNLSLAEAAKRWKAQNLPEEKKVADIIWAEVLEEFKKTKEGLSTKTKWEWDRRAERFEEVMNKRPSPTSGTDFVKKYARYWFDTMPSGSDSRKRYMDSVYKILEYGVNRHGMSERWLPPSKELAKELIGVSSKTKQERLTPPISEADLTLLLDTYKEENPRLYLAVGLIALHGLRLSELATLEVRDGNKLFVGSIKQNIQNQGKKIPPRRVFALDIKGKEGLGNELVAHYASGLYGLPEAVENQINMVEKKGRFSDVGNTLSQQLNRTTIWKQLTKKTKGLTPYSLRHRWAFIAHKASDSPISVRDAASSMGHTTTTHLSFYGSWTSEASIEAAVARHQKNNFNIEV